VFSLREANRSVSRRKAERLKRLAAHSSMAKAFTFLKSQALPLWRMAEPPKPTPRPSWHAASTALREDGRLARVSALPRDRPRQPLPVASPRLGSWLVGDFSIPLHKFVHVFCDYAAASCGRPDSLPSFSSKPGEVALRERPLERSGETFIMALERQEPVFDGCGPQILRAALLASNRGDRMILVLAHS
jgi:hypothetical protein